MPSNSLNHINTLNQHEERETKVERASRVHNSNGESEAVYCAAGIMPSNLAQNALLSFHFQHFYKLSAQTSQLPTQPLNSTFPAIIIITIHDSNLWNFWWESAKLFCGINHAQNSIFNPTFPLSSLETQSRQQQDMFILVGTRFAILFLASLQSNCVIRNEIKNSSLMQTTNITHHHGHNSTFMLIWRHFPMFWAKILG